MALVIEDGSVVAGAESYATAAELATYAANFGVIIPSEQVAQEVLLRRAALQMESMPWRGRVVQFDQSLQWPRAEVCRNGFTLDCGRIPAQIKAGQLALAAEIYSDDLADPAIKQGAITEETVGPLTTKYAAASSIVTKAAATRQSYAQFTGFVQSSSQVNLSRG